MFTDIDLINRSTTNRKVLFRNWDVGDIDFTSILVKIMDSDINSEAYIELHQKLKLYMKMIFVKPK